MVLNDVRRHSSGYRRKWVVEVSGRKERGNVVFDSLR